MEEKKPSTADILAKIRAQKAAAEAKPGEAPAAVPETTPPAEPAATVETPAAKEAPSVAKPAAAAGPKPTSTKDILAAIRAGGAKPGAAPATAAPDALVAATPPAAAAAAAPKVAAAAGPKLSTQEMLQKIREAKGAGSAAPAATAATVKPTTPVAAPPMPAKPTPAGKSGKPTATQRGMAGLSVVATLCAVFLVLGFLTGSSLLIGAGILVWGLLLSPFAAAWAAVTGVGGILTLGTARFMFPNVLVEPPSKFKVGPLSDYPLNTVSNKWKDQFGIWIVHTDQYEGRNLIFALASVCTHLGCTPNWLDGEQKFKCPCHGSGFYMTGINFEGPAPRPLERMGLRVAEDGMLEVNKSVKFQEEMGQWADSTSFVEVV
ncbi:ubiquinol-cytochrome c reductase iron-sulfur subunit [Schlesneria sp. DSM 10557]|uniref:QcrA and Rieske domain-containing protein n=1 Tax=Schlesneria sp. DSM 10557 TaxID=3044399 RepID=UPI0035A1A083